MKVVRPIEFVWCGILYIPGQTEAYLRSEPFVGELIGRLNTFSQVCDEDPTFTLNVVWQGSSQTVRDVTEDGIRFRASCLLCHELEGEHALLKPDTDCVGPRFVQVVVGSIDFLLAASRVLYVEDGWPEALSDDIEEAMSLLTRDKNILCFIRPQISEPLLISPFQSARGVEEYNQYLQ